MHHYLIYHGRGLATLMDDLGADPFALTSLAIVERLAADGYTPEIAEPRHRPWPAIGRVDEVESQGLIYLVAVDRDAEEITVQEKRDHPYDPVA